MFVCATTQKTANAIGFKPSCRGIVASDMPVFDMWVQVERKAARRLLLNSDEVFASRSLPFGDGLVSSGESAESRSPTYF